MLKIKMVVTFSGKKGHEGIRGWGQAEAPPTVVIPYSHSSNCTSALRILLYLFIITIKKN